MGTLDKIEVLKIHLFDETKKSATEFYMWTTLSAEFRNKNSLIIVDNCVPKTLII